ncbi:MAG: cobalamin biosynthesis protein, partial [Actinomycetospora chiangmaiensis]|nr:cobalamin biosynthesis protein [Actinomycetospora chiangmaiensis]
MVHPPETLAVLALALGIEAAAGYPDALYRAVGHPVTWIGRLIAALERGLNRGSPRRRRRAGCLAVALLLGVVGLTAFALTALAGLAGPLPALILLGLACASLPAQRSLHDHV